MKDTQLRGDIAIVGMGCLFAGAPNLDTYWNNILNKVDSVSDPPAGEWDPKIFYDPKAKSNDRVYCKRGGYIGDISEFRPLDFGIMPVTVDGGEPDQWLALRVAHEALADAGYSEAPPEHLRTEVILGKGTYVNRGNLTVGYHALIVEEVLQVLKNLHPEYTDREIADIKKELKSTIPPFGPDTAPALIGNIIAGRIANRLDLMGSSFTVDAACASGLLAIEIGIRDLLSRKCDLVLAGGANANAPLPTMTLFCQLGALSHSEKIRPFDKNADGTILGEGLGMIVLKRREDAERDGDRIYALIKGVGLASDGRALHVMAPRVEGEVLALRRAYEMADVSPETVGMIEAHGTATPLGDVVELQALSQVFGAKRGELPTCAIGSVKSMIGHTMPAAGIAGVIKTALALHHRVLPPTINCDEPNPQLHLERTPFHVNTEARPWIHGAETPRRAGVNSFGFGGINAHAVLEEYPEEQPKANSHRLAWDTEVCILEAESRSKLIERCGQLSEYLTRASDASLKDLAYTLNCKLSGQPMRLALIAKSKDDLAKKLSIASNRLRDPDCSQIKDNGGIYFFDRPLGGKLAFLFPGEGAQYPNMLLDLCLHFPEVRSCFDAIDRGLKGESKELLPSDIIFPRSLLPEADRSKIESRLWQLDSAVQAVLTGNWAMWTLLSQLEITPDAIAGHSTGDYSATLASGIVALNFEEFLQAMLRWKQPNSGSLEVPEAMLVAVAADSTTVSSIIEGIGGGLHIAMDNCPHQCVFAGEKSAAERAVEQLRSRGIIYEILPFDRPYHTPMFAAYAEGAGKEFFDKLAIHPARVETYSCTSAAPYPADAEATRRLFVAHWEEPVRFSETVKQMYADGVRVFVESGPRGNLTAFISDILRGQPHLAMPANVSRRSGISQLNHLIGVLAAQGIGMRLDYLYARRSPTAVPWEAGEPARPAKRTPPAMKVELGLPPLKVAARAKKSPVESVSPRNASHTIETVQAKTVNGNPLPPAPLRQAQPQQVASMTQTASVAVAPPPQAPKAAAASAAVMQEYFKGMETFLEVESQVMDAFLARTRPAEGRQRSASPGQFPLLGTIQSLVPGEQLIAERLLDPSGDLFLQDHALGGSVSFTDPSLRALVVVPLTMSMEVLAEAGAALMPDKVLIGMRDIQAHHWIQVGREPVRIEISARRESGEEVAVAVRNLSAGTKDAPPVLKGVMIFADSYPVPPKRDDLQLRDARTSALAGVPLYDGRLMFHGPCFQGVAGVERSGSNGAIGQLVTLPADKLFRSFPQPRLVTDPVLLDAAGQLVGFWAAEHLPRGFVVFPYHLERMRIFGPNRPPGERLSCSVEVRLIGEELTRSDIEIVGSDGGVWMQLEGWADRRFDPPPQFHAAWTAPRVATISRQWRAPLTGIPNSDTLDCFRVDSPFPPGAALWKDLWASLILSRTERRAFAEQRGPEHRQMEWLGGRTAAKDAVRRFIAARYGLELLPADIEIDQDEHGKPRVSGSWAAEVPAMPQISISHSEGVAVAIVGDGTKASLGVDVQAIRDVRPDFEALVLNAEESGLLAAIAPSDRAEWVLRLWSAKEAISKALGRGLIEGPSSVRIDSLDPRTGFVTASPQGRLAGAFPGASKLPAYTTREENIVVACALYEMGLRV